MADLGTLSGGASSFACGINAKGQVVGWSRTSSGNGNAFLDSNGTMSNLGTPPGWSSTSAYGINASGQVAGYAYNLGMTHAFLDSDGTWTDLGTLGDNTNRMYDSYATGINAGGQVVGYAYPPNNNSSGVDYYHAFIYSSGTMTDLNALVNPASGWTLAYAEGINDSGEIAGYGTNAIGNTDAFLLKPLPPGDANGDGTVDINDLTVVLTDFGEIAGMSWSTGDFNGDGKVDVNDLTVVLANYGTTAAARPAAVPEPGALVLLGVGAMAALAFAKRRRTSATGLARSFQTVVGLVPRPTLRLAPKGPNSIAQANGLGRNRRRTTQGPTGRYPRRAVTGRWAFGTASYAPGPPGLRPGLSGLAPSGPWRGTVPPTKRRPSANVPRGKVASPACPTGPGGASCVAGVWRRAWGSESCHDVLPSAQRANRSPGEPLGRSCATKAPSTLCGW